MPNLPEISGYSVLRSIEVDLSKITDGVSISDFLERIGEYYAGKRTDFQDVHNIQNAYISGAANCYQPTFAALLWGMQKGYKVGFRLFNGPYPHPFGYIDDGKTLLMFDYFAEESNPTRVGVAHRTDSQVINYINNENDLVTSIQLFDLIEALLANLETGNQDENILLLSEINRLDLDKRKNIFKFAVHMIKTHTE